MIDLVNYGFTPNMVPENGKETPARVIAVHKERYALICEHGKIFGRLKASVYYADTSASFPTTGDFVLINYNSDGDSQIVKTLERKTFFSRRDPTPSRGEQAIAANFDYVFIIQSLNNDFNLKRIERYLTLAWQSGATPVIILTKADVAKDDFISARMMEVGKLAIGVGIYAVSAVSGYGIEALGEYLKPQKTIVFLGSSGVGKSSLVNALSGENIMAVNTIREGDDRGRHTTTHRQLIMLESGVMVVDTPGMRELGMWDVSSGLGEAFSDVEQYIGMCNFSDCKHKTEPGCAILAAIESGNLSQERWESYLKLKREARFVDRKAKASATAEKAHRKYNKSERKFVEEEQI